MSTIAVFNFENSQVRTLGSSESPLFVAIDIAKALGYQNLIRSVNDHVDPEDIIKAEIETKGGRQTVNCVNESGMYALIFGSKLESAKRFKRWVTSEVLPAIRKTGRYECPAAQQLPPPVLTEQQAYAIMSEVSKRAKKDGAKYQTIYRALKARYQVTKYTHIPSEKFEDALRFIQTLTLNDPAVPKQAVPEKEEEKTYTVTAVFLESLRTFIYCWRYLHRADLNRFLELMRGLDSPHAAHFYEAIHSLNLLLIEDNLERLGFSVKELDCYKHWELAHAKIS